MILAGDIGGTKSLFGLFDERRCVVERRLTNADFPGFDEALAEFLHEHTGRPIAAACFALAGAVPPGARVARMTNLPWTLDADAVARRHGLPEVHLANDFSAAAMGAVMSTPEQWVTLQAGDPLEQAPCLVLGAGTGLGVALALPGAHGWQIVAGEGGHMAFAPADEQQLALWRFLQQRHGRVTWERVVSGPGLAAIHQFLGGALLAPPEIGQHGLDQPESSSAQALDLFLDAYGAFAGDMALATLPRGGVYLAGGIAAKVLPLLRRADGAFLTAFGRKAEHASLMPALPVRVVTDPAVGLRGAAALAGIKD